MAGGIATMRAMIELGLTDAQKLIMLAAMEADARPKDRTGADRQARYRDLHKVTRDVTGDKESGPQTPLKENTPLNGSPKGKPIPPLKPEHVVEAWNAMAERTGLPSVQRLTKQRRATLTCRIRQNSVDDFTEAIDAIERSAFLCGDNDRKWRADFDFLLQPKSFTKLIEGSYDR